MVLVYYTWWFVYICDVIFYSLLAVSFKAYVSVCYPTRISSYFEHGIVKPVSSILYIYIYIYIYIWSEIFGSLTGKSEAKHGGYGGPKLRRFQSPMRNFYYTSKHERPCRETETDVS